MTNNTEHLLGDRPRHERGWWRCAKLGAVGALMVLAACGDSGDDDGATGTTAAPSTTTTASTIPLPALGGRLLYSRFVEATHTFASTHTAAPDGSDETEIPLPGPEGGARWSHSGSEIAVMTILDDERVGTAIIRPDGGVDRVLTIPDPTLNLVCTVWTPDDSRLACEGWDDGDPSRRGIYEIDAADGGGLVRLTTPPEGVADLPGDFSPDGRTFLFLRTTDELPGRLMLLGVGAGTDPHALGDRTFDDVGRFSPDGALIAAHADGELFVLDVDGSVRSTISEEGHVLFGPAWSPDGEWLAYSRTSTGRYRADVYIARFDGSERHQVTDTPANEISVDWSREPSS